jgi:disulfide bond formation protein DsbB
MQPPKVSFVAFFLCTSVILFAYYAQYQWHIEPCPLCLIQRFFYFLLGLTFLGHALSKARLWLWFGMIWSLFGAITAGRQIILQHLPPEKVPACGPGLDYMFSTFSSNEILLELLHGSGECLSFAEWSFAGFALSMSTLLWALYSKK